MRGQGQEAGPQRMTFDFLLRLQLAHHWPGNTACILPDKGRPMGGEDTTTSDTLDFNRGSLTIAYRDVLVANGVASWEPRAKALT